MEKTLIIAEKPSVAKDIARVLGGFTREGDWLESDTAVVSSALGHLVEIGVPEGEDVGFNLDRLPMIPPAFELVPIKRTSDQLKLLGKLLKRSDISTVVNACDAGREGELIFRYIYNYHRCTKTMKRLWLQSMTPDAIREAWKKMKDGSTYDALYDAAVSRSEADWLVGVNGTRATSLLRERQTGSRERSSVGRVQTPTLAILVDREIAIRNFKPRNYWEIHGTFGLSTGEYAGKWFDQKFRETSDPDAKPDRCLDVAQAQVIVDKCRNKPVSSVDEETKPTSKAPPKLFDLTTLQREANTKFGFSAKKTLDIAQALYETHKVLTYPRTDSCHLPSDYVPTAKATVGKFADAPDYGPHATRVLDNDWIKPVKSIFNDAKISDHFAIIPTGVQPSALSADEGKIFDLVTRRFLAAFHPAAEYLLTTRITVVAEESFKSTGRVLVKEGWLLVYGRDADDDETPTLPKLAAGEIPDNVKIDLVALKTKAPSRFTEASLLAAMENAGKQVEDEDLRDAMSERGLGTPATRAAMIEKLLVAKDGKGNAIEPYAVREKKNLVPTAKGEDLILMLRSLKLETITQPLLTGEWEFKLRQMEKQQYSRPEFMAEIEAYSREIIERIRTEAGSVKQAPGVGLAVPCPKCSNEIKANGKAFSCACGFSLWREVAGRKMSAEELELLVKNGRTGVLKGFLSRARKKFDAALVLTEEGKVEFDLHAGDVEMEEACPLCGGIMVDSDKVCACLSCEFKLWKEIAKRKLKPKEFQSFLKEKRVGPLDGFVSKAGKKFSATLTLDAAGKVQFDFGEGQGGGQGEAKDAGFACPNCGKGISETTRLFACTACEFKVRKEIAGRPVSRQEAMSLATSRSTAVLSGFVSKAGKKFNARLVLEDSGNIGFSFD